MLTKFVIRMLNNSLNLIYFRNALFNPHTGHNSTAGGILSSTGFKIDGNDNEMFFSN